MTGIGEHIENVALPDGLFAVLANPLVSVPQNKTARVFALLAAPPITSDRASENSPEFSTVEQVIAYAAARGNALEEPARELFPIIDTLLSELGQLAGSSLRAAFGRRADVLCALRYEARGRRRCGRTRKPAPRLVDQINAPRLALNATGRCRR